jgi:hypothetical protein
MLQAIFFADKHIALRFTSKVIRIQGHPMLKETYAQEPNETNETNFYIPSV